MSKTPTTDSSPISSMTEANLRKELLRHGVQVGPVIPSTRKMYEKKLQKLLMGQKKNGVGGSQQQANRTMNGSGVDGGEQGGSPVRKTTPKTKERVEMNPLKDQQPPQQRGKGASPSVLAAIDARRNIQWTSGEGSSQILRGRTSFGWNQNDHEEVDDHMESSRIVSPESFKPIWGQRGGGAQQKVKQSPVEKLKKIFGFFSRPLGTSTPCSDVGYKNAGYASAKYRRQSHPSSYSFEGGRYLDTKKSSPDLSRWIVGAVVVFLSLLIGTYVVRVQPEVVYKGLSTAGDVILATFRFLYSYAIMPTAFILFVCFIAFGIYHVYAYRTRQKTEENRNLMLLVERITDIIYDSGNAGVAEPHVRDMIMPPTKRTNAEYKRWQEAARFINNEDSRIRTEIRLIGGTECNVWIWTGAGKQRWQGTGN